VLIAGKGHEDEQIVGSERRPYSDRAVAAELLEAVS
jgi:UDP-N-acetylmuramoyl-L-alanyl-D-glutamate--2,6-diaminopimelate ligase